MRWLFLLMFWPLVVLADDRQEVDVELFLAVDLSRSMNPFEIEIQRRGYSEALASDDVWAAIQDGLIGRIAISYVEWAGEYSQREIVPWTMIDSQDDLKAVAELVGTQFSNGMQRTSISGILLYAAESIDSNEYNGLRRVIDISGDGPNNQGRPVLRARDHVLSSGIIINGLPLMTRDEWSRIWDIDDLDTYYRNCVIGGPGAFALPVHDWAQFGEAIKRKLILEIAGLPAQITFAQVKPAPDYDCLVGEKLWQQNRRYFDLP